MLSLANPRSAPFAVGFAQRLRELGYVEGHNLSFAFRNAEGQLDRLPALAAELVRLRVGVLVTPGPEATLRAARQVTSTIPVVMIAVHDDPLARGYVGGLARPEGNSTGVFFLQLE
jgi:putative tryptophan/tyrosine transport system substrate-binding protein